MKKVVSLMLAFAMMLSLLPVIGGVETAEAAENVVLEAASWEELKEAFDYAPYRYKEWTVKLTEDLYGSASETGRSDTEFLLLSVKGSKVTLDFNGHTLHFSDTVSSTDLESTLSDFIRIDLHSYDHDVGSVLRITDSVGGGGITMNSHRGKDNQIAALHVADDGTYYLDGVAYQSGSHAGTLIIDGGNFSLTSEIDKFSNGTVAMENGYRACVVADSIAHTTINGGTFTARSKGVEVNGTDFNARELSAFATCAHARIMAGRYTDKTVINNGLFMSDGYAVHNFDRGLTIDYSYADFPTINGGAFQGALSYVGAKFNYQSGFDEYNEKPATTVIAEDAYVLGIDGDGDRYDGVADMTLEDLHEVRSCYVLSPQSIYLKVSPSSNDGAPLLRSRSERETIAFICNVPDWWEELGVTYKPFIAVTDKKDGTTVKLRQYSTIVDYANYPWDATVRAGLEVTLGGSTYELTEGFEVDVGGRFVVTDECSNCSIKPVDTGYTVKRGDSFSFTVTPDDYYQFTGEPFYVFANEKGIEPVGGVYTVENVTSDLVITSTSPTGYAEITFRCYDTDGTLLKISGNWKRYVGEKLTIYDIGTYGFSVPEGCELDHWRMITPEWTKEVQPYDVWGVDQVGEIFVDAVWKGYHAISVENGTAYLDADFTTPVSSATKGTVIYVKADAPAAGSKFDIFNILHNSLTYLDLYTEDDWCRFTMPDDEVALAAQYYIPVEGNMTVQNVSLPEAGSVLTLYKDAYYNPVEAVAEEEPYRFAYSYWYDESDDSASLKDGHVFEAGHTYRYEVTLYARAGYRLGDPAKMHLTLAGLDPKSYTVSDCYLVGSGDYVRFIVRFGPLSDEGHIHTMTPVKAVEPGCTKIGNIAYYICVCGGWFYDEAGTRPITDKGSVRLPTLGGHAYEGGVCSRCGDVALVAPTVTVTNRASDGKPSLKWDAVDGASKYYIYRATSKTGTYKYQYATTKTSYNNTSAVAGKTYYYKVVAVDAAGNKSDYSAAVSRTCDLAQPTNLKVTPKADTGKPYLTWDAVDGADRYEIWRATSKTGTYTKTYTTTKTSYNNTGAVANKTYYYKVRAVMDESSYASSAYSTVKSITCDCAAPVISITVKADSGKPYLTWKAVSGAEKYEIWRATSKDGEFTKLYTTTKTSYTNTGAVAGKTYYYKVKALGSSSYATSAFSNVKSITCDCAKPVVTITTSSAGKPSLKWDAVSGATKYEIWRATSADGEYTKMYTTTKTTYTNTGAKSGVTYYYKVRALGSNSNATSAYSAVVSITAK